MASTSRASRKRVEEAEIFQVLEESTDSDVTIFSSEEDEDGNEPDSDEDGQLDYNSETNEDGSTRTRYPLYSTRNRQLTVTRNLLRQLIGTFTSRKRTGRKRRLRIGTALGNAIPMGKLLFLFPTLRKISGRAKVYALCIEKKKKAQSGKGKQTTYKCKQCDLPLCRVGYFLEYHEQRNVEVHN